MTYHSVFRSLTGSDSRLGFYTKETAEEIPERPGCYAWLLPLWLYCTDFDELMGIVGNVIGYEQESVKGVDVPFTWDTVKLQVGRAVRTITRERTLETWEKVLADDKGKEALQQTLLEASLLMPPLYVGRTNSLKDRYLQHTDSRRFNENTFHSRFTKCAEDLNLKISVTDLLFVCIETPKELRKALGESDESEPNLLIEHMLMQLCRPPFSLR